MSEHVLTIIGCGNPNRCDDGVGVYVAQQLLERQRSRPSRNIQIFDAGTDGMGVMFQARGSSALVIVDASKSGSEPGAIFEVPGDELESEPPASFNLHDFRWDHALHAGRQIFKNEFPSDVTVYLIEGHSTELGLGLSEPVADAAVRVIEMIEQRIARHEPK